MLSFTIPVGYRLSSSMKSYSVKLTSDLNSRLCFLFFWVGAKAIHDSRMHRLCWTRGTYCSRTIWGPFIILTTIAKHTVTSERSPVSFSSRLWFDKFITAGNWLHTRWCRLQRDARLFKVWGCAWCSSCVFFFSAYEDKCRRKHGGRENHTDVWNACF